MFAMRLARRAVPTKSAPMALKWIPTKHKRVLAILTVLWCPQGNTAPVGDTAILAMRPARRAVPIKSAPMALKWIPTKREGVLAILMVL